MTLGFYLVGILFGVALGYCVQRAALCFAVGLGDVFMGRGKMITKMFLVIFVITAIGFLLLGLKPIGQIRGYGFFNVLSGILFGAGIFACGGCILGSLRQMGEGNMSYLVVVLFMIPGMWLVVHVINPLLSAGYDIKKVLLPQLFQAPAAGVTTVLVIGAIVWLYSFKKK